MTLAQPPSDSPRPYRRRGLLAALGFAASALFVAALALDRGLRGLGIAMHLWADAAWSVAVATVAAYFAARLFWRVGLTSLAHYMIGGFALMTPLTIASFLGPYLVDATLIRTNWIAAPQTLGHQILLTTLVRLIRAALLVPVFLLAFYWFYHVHLRMAPER